MAMVEDRQFPLYRKYANEQRYYKIMSLTEFEEIQRIGKRFITHQHKAIQYPEKLFILDLIEMKLEGILVCEELEYHAIR
jgi:hypothetical protein